MLIKRKLKTIIIGNENSNIFTKYACKYNYRIFYKIVKKGGFN
jgi:hypothetical protein